jgi:hypothetical protein
MLIKLSQGEGIKTSRPRQVRCYYNISYKLFPIRHRQLNSVKAVFRCFQLLPGGSKLLKMRSPLRT